MKRICPECGRLLETKKNRFKVEVWPSHRAKIFSGPEANVTDEEWRAVGWRVPASWLDPCFNSGQPVEG